MAAAVAVGLIFGLGAPAYAQDAAPAPAEAVAPAADATAAAEALVAEEGVDPDAVVATVNGVPITERDLSVTAQIMGDQLTQYPQENWREILIQVAIEFRLVANAADAQALGDNPFFQAEMALIRERLLRDDYVQQFIVPTVTEDDLAAAYQAAVAGLNLPTEVQIRHIMVATEAEANDIIQQLNNGADFAQLAIERSLDRTTGELGGLIDVYWAPGELIQEFDDVVFTVPAGEILPFPVEFDGNWHVIKVDDSRLRSPPAYDDLRATLQQQLVAQAYGDAVNALRAAATIVIVDDTAPAPAPADAPAAPAAGDTPAPAAPAGP
jgi:peptidyl-prolyl cis-trans isomerase C